MLGRTVSIFHEDDTQVIFQPALTGTPLHPNAFPSCVAAAMTRGFVDSFRTEHGIPIVIKWKTRVLWEGLIDPTITVEVITRGLMYTMSPISSLCAIRLIHKAKHFAAGPFSQIADAKSPDESQILFVTFEQSGGAGPTATKTRS